MPVLGENAQEPAKCRGLESLQRRLQTTSRIWNLTSSVGFNMAMFILHVLSLPIPPSPPSIARVPPSLIRVQYDGSTPHVNPHVASKEVRLEQLEKEK